MLVQERVLVQEQVQVQAVLLLLEYYYYSHLGLFHCSDPWIEH